MTDKADKPLLKTPLHALHEALGARMVPFAGYAMPVQYASGILAEHKHTRTSAGLFDVSHMGQAFLTADDGDAVAAALEIVVPGAIHELKPGRCRYTLLLNDDGGIRDDLMVTRPAADSGAGRLFLVVNAACKADDFGYIGEMLSGRAQLDVLDGRALLALQGPKAAEVLSRHVPDATTLTFMGSGAFSLGADEVFISRSGYTGEDGFEISISADRAEGFAQALLDEREVAPIGLGARDSLRLEAGLCLYGHDIDETTSPIEADLAFTIGKRRKMDRDFPGADRIMSELFEGTDRKRVGFKVDGRTPAREGATIVSPAGDEIGTVTSGTFGPSVGAPIGMGYVPPDFAEDGAEIGVVVRGKPHPAHVAAMPFVPHRYVRAKS